MPRTTTISRQLIHYAFLTVCIGGFLLSCCGFLFYRLLLKPLVFGLILLVTLPLIVISPHQNRTVPKQNITGSE